MLATWNAETFEKAVLSPVEVELNTKKSKTDNDEDKSFIANVKARYEQYLLSHQSQEELDIGGDIEVALAYYDNKLKANPLDYVSMAYYGSYLAMKGGESSVIKAVALVNEAYVYLDKACELAYEKDGEIEVLMNRAHVCASVPETVFGKAKTGANDFMRIVLLTEEDVLKAYCYVMASECYENCGMESEAFIALQEAKKIAEKW